jgi:hypothetical protein
MAGKKIIKLFPARESLASDIPTGDGKTANFFYSVEPENFSYFVTKMVKPPTYSLHTSNLKYFIYVKFYLTSVDRRAHAGPYWEL